MEVGTLSCNNCGGVIELPDTTNYATCARCGAHLVVRREETAHYTEVLAGSDDPVQNATDTEAELSRMKIEMAIMSLDQEWEGKRTQLMVRSRDGHPIEPSISQVITYLLGILGSLVFLGLPLITDKSMAHSIGVLGFWIVGVFVVVFAGLALRRYRKYKEYVTAANAYLDRRDALIDRRWEQQKRLSS
jgi:DNA-directed RNA polymerase subunit RPC12/RpoP